MYSQGVRPPGGLEPARVVAFAARVGLLGSIPGIGPVSAAMPIAELPEFGRMTAGEAAAMTGLAPVLHDSGAMRGKRAIAGVRRPLGHVLGQAALAEVYHNPVLKTALRVIVTLAARLLKRASRGSISRPHGHSCYPLPCIGCITFRKAV